ncbi:IS3 family transposase [Pontibacter sp. XAAS-A31]|nr:IS3 family transposase [Pontibacter harenae]MCC9168380.1 IS3 family transposase [Pontibacter harenae]
MQKAEGKKSKRTQRDYTLGFKLQVVAEVERGDLTYKQAQKKYGIQGRSTVLVWLRKHGKQTWSATASDKAMDNTPNQRIKELEAQLAEAQERARQAELKAKLLDTLIDVAEGEFGFEIRKRPSPKQSSASQRRKKMSISRSCQLFGYTRQAYYKRRKVRTGNELEEQQVLELVQEKRLKMPRLGTRKLHFLLQDGFAESNLKIGRDRLFTLLGSNRLLIRPRKSYVKTTDSKHWLRRHKNLVEELEITRPEQVFVSDITYVYTDQGYSYLSLVSDAYSKQIMGYCLARDLKAEGPLQALGMAIGNRKYSHPLIHHSDRGLQYCCADYQQALVQAGIRPSMTEQYDPYQNAVAERINGILKDEFFIGDGFGSHQQAEKVIEESIAVYNNLRPHQSCRLLTPRQMHSQQKVEMVKWKKKASKAQALEAKDKVVILN